MRRNNCGCGKGNNNNFTPNFEFDNNGGDRCPREFCNRPIRKHLEPVLVARIYNQPIVEEIPCSAMSMTLDNNACISNAHTDRVPICGERCDAAKQSIKRTTRRGFLFSAAF